MGRRGCPAGYNRRMILSSNTNRKRQRGAGKGVIVLHPRGSVNGGDVKRSGRPRTAASSAAIFLLRWKSVFSLLQTRAPAQYRRSSVTDTAKGRAGSLTRVLCTDNGISLHILVLPWSSVRSFLTFNRFPLVVPVETLNRFADGHFVGAGGQSVAIGFKSLRCTGCNASIRASPRSMSNTCIPSIAPSTSLLGPA